MSFKSYAVDLERLRGTIRAIELNVDALNKKAFTQRPETQAALNRIKQHCREALRDYKGPTEA